MSGVVLIHALRRVKSDQLSSFTELFARHAALTINSNPSIKAFFAFTTPSDPALFTHVILSRDSSLPGILPDPESELEQMYETNMLDDNVLHVYGDGW